MAPTKYPCSRSNRKSQAMHSAYMEKKPRKSGARPHRGHRRVNALPSRDRNRWRARVFTWVPTILAQAAAPYERPPARFTGTGRGGRDEVAGPSPPLPREGDGPDLHVVDQVRPQEDTRQPEGRRHAAPVARHPLAPDQAIPKHKNTGGCAIQRGGQGRGGGGPGV